MNSRVLAILSDLQTVDRLRAERAADPSFGACVLALKRFQQHRFRHTYADLLASSRYAGAAHFFLDELYGPVDFSHRDAQFARVVPALVRLFPADVVETVATLARLHALSEELDSVMACHLPDGQWALRAQDYVLAWVATGRPADRQTQVELTLQVGRCLDRYTRNPILRHSLRMMRGPARAAGLAQLQVFLECGFDTFANMQGADHFLELVRQRETAVSQTLFAVEAPESQHYPARMAAAELVLGGDAPSM